MLEYSTEGEEAVGVGVCGGAGGAAMVRVGGEAGGGFEVVGLVVGGGQDDSAFAPEVDVNFEGFEGVVGEEAGAGGGEEEGGLDD